MAPEISGNTFEAGYTDPPSGALFLVWDRARRLICRTRLTSRITSPTTALGTYAYALKTGGSLDYSTDGGTSYYFIYVNAGDASASGAANPGDTIVVAERRRYFGPDHRHQRSHHRCARRLERPESAARRRRDHDHAGRLRARRMAPTSTSPATVRATPSSATRQRRTRPGRRQRPLDADRRRRHGHLRLRHRIRRGDDHQFRSGRRRVQSRPRRHDRSRQRGQHRDYAQLQSDMAVDGNATPSSRLRWATP